MISSSAPAGTNCGDIILTVTDRDGTPIDPAVWSWDPVTQAFTTETSDTSYYLGEDVPYPFRIEARYEAYQTAPAAGIFDFNVLLMDPCASPTSVTAAATPNPPDYYYTSAPIVDISLNPFTVDPIMCLPEMVYGCQIVMGPRLDICDILGTSAFDPVTGGYTF